MSTRRGEEDDEALEVAKGKMPGKSSEIIQVNRGAATGNNNGEKKKHWLLDSDRFDIVMQNNA